MATQQYKHTQVRSPYFVQMASTEAGVTAEIYIWTGDGLADVPVSPQYILTKEVYDGAATFEISELIRDFLNQNSTLTSGAAWWKVDLNDGVASTTTYKQLALEGYELYDAGLQHPGSNTIPEKIYLPTDTDGSCRITTGTGANGVIPVVFNNNNAVDWGYTAYDLAGGVLLTNVQAVSELSNNQIKYIVVNTNYSRVEFDLGDTTQICHVDQLRCAEYEPVRLLYVNKAGAKNYFHFNLKSTESIGTSSDEFKRSLVNYNGLTNGNNLHAVRKRITGSKQSFVLNTDWVAEYYVKQLEELLLSEYVWLVRITGNPIPVNVKTSKIQKKTHLNDKLINYSMEVETASEYINTVR